MRNDVILNKISVIERCMKRVRDVYANDAGSLKDFTKQDSIIINIQRACEASIELAMHIVAEQRLGLPQTSRDAFDMLHTALIIDENTAKRLKVMVGFRNMAVHDYQPVNENHLGDFIDYT
ncbi:uncharacterized protein YutE (UPF0331/DUF86 family) [Peribacillus sp. B2I2]|uniref:type VII toxin-antitoxin system HepT family RNase toxin n=1 Tax=Peribacillus sp. B2I2 TaxID=3156468 RepID=UPI003513E52E